MNKNGAIFITLLLLLVFPNLQGQNRFKAGMVLGANMAQIDGDEFSGYYKPGINGGLQGIIKVNKQFDIYTELRYSIIGSKSKNDIPIEGAYPFKRAIHLTLHYIEVPVLINIHHKLKEKKKGQKYYQYGLQLGLSYNRLLHTKVEESYLPDTKAPEDYLFSELEPHFDKNDLNFVAGANYYFNPRFGIGIRHSVAFSHFYKASSIATNNAKDFRNFFLTLQALYQI